MPIDSTTVFDRMEITCDCADGSIGAANLYDGGWGGLLGADYVAPVPQVHSGRFDADNAEVQEVISRIEAGTCPVYYRGTGGGPDRGLRWLEADMPHRYSFLRSLHPFHPTNGYLIPNVMLDHGKVATDAPTGLRKIEHEYGLVTRSRTPDGTTFDYRLNDWLALSSGTTRFALRLTLSRLYTDATIESAPEIVAFKSWLRANMNAGTAIPADANLIFDTDDNYDFEGSGRQYTFPQPDGTNVVTTIIQVNSVFDSGNYEFVRIEFQRQSSAAHNIDQLNALFRTATGAIPAATAQQHPPIGPHDGGPITTGSVIFQQEEGGPQFKLFVRHGRLMVRGVDHLNKEYELPIEGKYGRRIELTGLSTNSDGHYLAPLHHDTIIYSGGQNVSYRFRSARDMVISGATHRDIFIINLSVTGWLDILDPGGTQIFRLLAGESATFQVSLSEDGSGDIVSLGQLPPRRQTISAGIFTGAGGLLNDPPYWIYTNNRYMRMFPLPTEVDFNHQDAFEIPSGEPTSGLAIGATQSWEHRYVVKLKQSGLLTMKCIVDLRTQDGITGDIATPEIHLLHIPTPPAVQTPTQFISNSGVEIVGLGHQQRFQVSDSLVVLAGDTVMAGFVYPQSSTASLEHIREIFFQRELSLNTTIDVFSS